MGIDDVDDAGQLIRYALAAQLARLERFQISETKVALGAGMKTSSTLTNLKKGIGTGRLDGKTLRSLDSSIVGLAPETEALGGLNSLGIRLRGLTKRDSLVAHLPASWTWEMLREEADTEFAVLVQASALLSLFIPIHQAGRSPSELRERYKKDKIQPLVKRLALIGGAPPTSRNIDALVLLGGLTKCAWDKDLGDLVERKLDSPLGFRLWRAITKLVHLCEENLSSTGHLEEWVTGLLTNAEDLRQRSIYPGRSLDLELAITIPYDWSRPDSPGGDWVGELLLARARDDTATLRERGTAAMGLWQRTLSHNPDRSNTEQAQRVKGVEDELRELARAFAGPDARADVAAGMRWVAATLVSVLDAKVPVCNTWPVPDPMEPWWHVVQDATNQLDAQNIPAHILDATKILFQHMLLQNAGVQRRQAIDTLLAGGWANAIIKGLAHVLQNEKEQSWLRVRALFAIGFLQCRDGTVAQILINACHEAYAKLESEEPTDAQITEMHAVLFSIGDCFGASFGVRDRGRLSRVRNAIADILKELVEGDRTSDPRFYPVARALVYLLTFTAQERRGKQVDLSETLLQSMHDHPDPVTRDFREWALRFRFTDEGELQALLHAADYDD